MVRSDMTKIPDGWRRVRLGEVAEINRDSWTPENNDTILYLDLTAVDSPGRVSAPKLIAAKHVPSRARRKVISGDILVSTVRPYLRGFARIKNAPDNLVASTGFAVVTPHSDVAGSLIYHHIMTHKFMQYLENHMTGQAYPAIRPEDVSSFKLLLPPLSEQQGIASVLDSIDEAIESTEATITTTESLRDSLRHQLLTRGVPGWHTEWRDVPGIGTIPIDWQVVGLGDCAFLRRKAVKTVYNDSRPYIALENIISNGPLNSYGRAGDSMSPKTCFYKGDTLYGKLRPNLRKVVRVMFDGVCSTDILAISATNRINESYLCCILQSDSLYRHAMQGVSGTRMPRTSWNHLEKFKFGLPSDKEQKIISKMLESVNETIRIIKVQISQFTSFKEVIMESLLTGRVQIKEC